MLASLAGLPLSSAQVAMQAMLSNARNAEDTRDRRICGFTRIVFGTIGNTARCELALVAFLPLPPMFDGNRKDQEQYQSEPTAVAQAAAVGEEACRNHDR